MCINQFHEFSGGFQRNYGHTIDHELASDLIYGVSLRAGRGGLGGGHNNVNVMSYTQKNNGSGNNFNNRAGGFGGRGGGTNANYKALGTKRGGAENLKRSCYICGEFDHKMANCQRKIK